MNPAPETPGNLLVPFTIREALYGNEGLEPCVTSFTYQWSPDVLRHLLRFLPIIDRPKQAIQHLLELFILHICTLDVSWDAKWVSNLVNYLAAISQHLIPHLEPNHTKQWTALIRDKRGRVIKRVLQAEETYPKSQEILSEKIIDIIGSYSESFQEPDLTYDVLSKMTGLMDEPAKTAIIVYAWFLQSRGIHNGWLKKHLNSPLGRRERQRRHTPSPKEDRLDRADEPLHTLFSHPFIDNHGHLVWNTVRTATRDEILCRPATSYARGNNVRIHTSKDLSKSVQVRRSHVCNLPVLDLRLWESWVFRVHGIGPFSSLAKQTVPARVVRFDSPVYIDSALAVGFRVVHGNLYAPDGHQVLVTRRSDGLYKAHSIFHKSQKQGLLEWHTGMKFA